MNATGHTLETIGENYRVSVTVENIDGEDLQQTGYEAYRYLYSNGYGIWRSNGYEQIDPATRIHLFV